jgi:hypothetical protein
MKDFFGIIFAVSIFIFSGILVISYPYGLYISFFKGFWWLMLALVFPPYSIIAGLIHMFS